MQLSRYLLKYNGYSLCAPILYTQGLLNINIFARVILFCPNVIRKLPAIRIIAIKQIYYVNEYIDDSQRPNYS